MKISIITVCLNSENTIEKTIQSVLSQQYDDFEYIIIDGKSTDKTLEIIKKYSDEISIIVSEPDYGIYDAMNKGIALANGDIIGIINSDDWYESGVFDVVNKCFVESDAEVIYGNLNLINDDGYDRTLVPTDIKKIWYEMEIPHPTVFVKQEVYQKYGVFSLKYKIAADYELMLRYYSSGVKFVYLNQTLANFRMDGISIRQNKMCIYEAFEVAESYLPCIPTDERGYYENILSYRIKEYRFGRMLAEGAEYFAEFVKCRMDAIGYDKAVIFGAGNWGMESCRILTSKGIKIQCIVDNNEKKWGKSDVGIEISEPKVLQTFQGVVLLLVKDFTKEILQQIQRMNNINIDCITWEEIAMSREGRI